MQHLCCFKTCLQFSISISIIKKIVYDNIFQIFA